MTDFIAQTKLPGVLLAKAMISKTNFDLLLQHDEELKKRLTDIGYTVKLSPGTKSEITNELNAELKSAHDIINTTTRKAEIFSTILTETLKHLAEKSPHDTEIIYHLSQILFIWDEFIDFSDYQKYHGDVTKIRESIYYRAACIAIQDITDEDMVDLKNHNFDKIIYKPILSRLQLSITRQKFSSGQYFSLLESLKKDRLTSSEIVYFLLILESALFMKISERLIKAVDSGKIVVFKGINNLDEGISKVRNIFSLDENKLEKLIEDQAENLLMDVGYEIIIN